MEESKKETKKEKASKFLREKAASILFDLITDIPESIHAKDQTPEAKAQLLTQRAALKAATISATLSIPAGLTGILTAVPDIAAIWKVQAQLVADIAATYGKLALLSREAMIWCLFRHSAGQLLRDIAVRTGSRIVIQKVSFATLSKILQKIGMKVSSKFLGKTILKAIPALGALGNGAYTYYDTNEVGKTATNYFKALADTKDTTVTDAEIVEDKP